MADQYVNRVNGIPIRDSELKAYVDTNLIINEEEMNTMLTNTFGFSKGHYIITYTYSGHDNPVEMSNTDTTVIENEAFECNYIVDAPSTYITTITVVMGGTDISDSVVSKISNLEKKISIDSVTGDLQINIDITAG